MSATKDIGKFLKNGYDPNKRNSVVPKPPKKGEVMVCQMCGKEMLPEDFSKDDYKRKKEFKWQQHWDCMQKAQEMCDRKTPGLLSERGQR